MRVRITPGTLKGKIDAVSSKSYLHRMILCAALSDRDTIIYLNCRSRDVDATIRCAAAMGADIQVEQDRLVVHPVDRDGERGGGKAVPLLDCGESGSTARFVLPMAAAVCGGGTLTGEGRLPERPFGEICRVMEENGCWFSSHRLPMEARGYLKSGIYRIPANISSQYISALMMSLPLVDGDSEILFTTEVESEGYLDITESVMKDFGVELEKTGHGYRIAGGRRYASPGVIRAEGDWSNGAFWVAANALGCQLEIGNLRGESLQRDSRIVQVAERLSSGSGPETDEIVIDGADIPDIIPISAIVACRRVGRTRFIHCQRLRLKESDRLVSAADTVRALGGRARTDGDDLVIEGTGHLTGGTVDSFGDHRIVMSAAIAAVICAGEVVIDNAQDVAKSYPGFFDDYAALLQSGNIVREEAGVGLRR